MSSSQTITPTILALGASKNTSPSAEIKGNNTFNQVFKNEVANKAKKTPVETVKSPVLNKNNNTPSNSTSATSKNPTPPTLSSDAATNKTTSSAKNAAKNAETNATKNAAVDPSTGAATNATTDTITGTTTDTTNLETNTASSNSNSKEAQSGSVDQIDEDDIRAEDQKLPDLNDPVSLFNFVNKINELSQASTSSLPSEKDNIAKTSEILPTTAVNTLDTASLIAPTMALKTPELSPPKQVSEVNAATTKVQGSVDGELPQSRFMSELSAAKDAKQTPPPTADQSQTTSVQTPTIATSNANIVADTVLKKEAVLSQLPTQPRLPDAVKVSVDIPNKPAPMSSESSRISAVNSHVDTTTDLTLPKNGGAQQNVIDRITQALTPPPSSNSTTAIGKLAPSQSAVLASQLKTSNQTDTRTTSLNERLRAPAELNALTKSISETLATVGKVEPSKLTTAQINTVTKNIEIPLTGNTPTQALPAAPELVIPIQAPSDSPPTKDLPIVSLPKPVTSELTANPDSQVIEKPQQSITTLSSSELFSSALNTEFALAQQEQHVSQETIASEEFAVNKMASESTPPAPIAQAPAPAAAVLNSVPMAEHIAARFGTRAWDQAIGQKIVWMVAGGEQTAQLTLNPPDLGPVQVVLSISDSFVDASFVSSHLDVREAIEAAAPKLREMMDNAGISLSGFSVSAESAQSGNPFNSEKSQQNSQSQARNTSRADEVIDSGKLNTPIQRTQPELGLVDTFA